MGNLDPVLKIKAGVLDFTPGVFIQQAMVSLSSRNLADLNQMASLAAKADDLGSLRKEMVTQVHRIFGSTSTIFWQINKQNQLVDPVFQGIQDQFFPPYKSYFYQQNPFDPANLPRIYNPSVRMEQLVPLSQFHKTQYYNEFLKPQNIHRQMAVYIPWGERLTGVLGMHRSEKKRFGSHLLVMGNMMAGHWAAAFERLRLATEIEKADGFLNMLTEHTADGILILDKQCRSLFSNTLARKICSCLATVFPVAATANAEVCRFPQLVADTCRQLAVRLNSPGLIPVPLKEILVSVAPFRSIGLEFQIMENRVSGHSQPIFLIKMTQKKVGPEPNFLKQEFGLTPREIEIVSQVCRGLTNLQIARVLFISEGTVKNHLKRVFSKLGVKSRASLIFRMVSRVPREISR
jgi:DNA-binding CsgD family transcriptional regulator